MLACGHKNFFLLLNSQEFNLVITLQEVQGNPLRNVKIIAMIWVTHIAM